MKGNLVWRLLRRNISVGQIAGYAVANLVGLTIVLTALQFYRDSTAPDASGDDSFINRDYLILSKEVSETGSFLGNTTTFSDAETADLAAQPWVEKTGRFTPSRFHVSGAVEFNGRGMSTHLFFESIPDEFFDVKPTGWHYNPADSTAEVPIILAKDYLALYNFGFAASRGLPQISENLISKFPLRLTLSGNGHRQVRTGRVVGFSSRLNTIAVPDEFMQWANATFGEDPDSEPSRLIVEVNDPGNPSINDYLTSRGIEIAGDKANQGKMAYFLSILSAVVIAIGAVISALSFFILMLSIYLLLQKNREKVHDLMQLGYTISQTAFHYNILVIAVNGSILVLSVAAMLVISRAWTGPFENIGMTTVSPLPTIAAGIILMGAVTAVNIMAINRIVKRNFYN